MEPAFLFRTGSMTWSIAVQFPAAVMIKVPGEITSSPLGYLCFMERESFPVGILIPNSMAKSEQACTASYNRASSPSLLQGHIQFAESDTPDNPFLMGANTRLDKASAMAFLEPAAGSTKAVSGECPKEVAIPSLDL